MGRVATRHSRSAWRIAAAAVTVKSELLVAVPAAVVTVTAPVVAALGTVAVTCVLDTRVYFADTLLNCTLFTLVNPDPVIVTSVPVGAESGLSMSISGSTVNDVADVPVPPAVVTEIVPVVVPGGTTAVICVVESTLYVVAAVPWNLTAVTPVNGVPVMTTLVPIVADPGANSVIAGRTRNVVDLAVPVGVTTEIWPVVAVAGTVAVTVVADTGVNDAGVPLKLTAVGPVSPPPLIVTSVPTGPMVGEIPLIDGFMVNLFTLVAGPSGVDTAIGPVNAAGGTVAVSWVVEAGVKDALTPPMVTLVAVSRSVPVTITLVPALPDVGVNDETDGVASTFSDAVSVIGPMAPVTV